MDVRVAIFLLLLSQMLAAPVDKDPVDEYSVNEYSVDKDFVHENDQREGKFIVAVYDNGGTIVTPQPDTLKKRTIIKATGPIVVDPNPPPNTFPGIIPFLITIIQTLLNGGGAATILTSLAGAVPGKTIDLTSGTPGTTTSTVKFNPLQTLIPNISINGREISEEYQNNLKFGSNTAGNAYMSMLQQLLMNLQTQNQQPSYLQSQFANPAISPLQYYSPYAPYSPYGIHSINPHMPYYNPYSAPPTGLSAPLLQQSSPTSEDIIPVIVFDYDPNSQQFSNMKLAQGTIGIKSKPTPIEPQMEEESPSESRENSKFIQQTKLES